MKTARTISMKQYLTDKASFYRKHYGEHGYKEQGGCEGATIRKMVLFEDGATWYEVTEPIYETVVVDVHGISVETQVKLYRTEIWDTEDQISRFLYER